MYIFLLVASVFVIYTITHLIECQASRFHLLWTFVIPGLYGTCNSSLTDLQAQLIGNKEEYQKKYSAQANFHSIIVAWTIPLLASMRPRARGEETHWGDGLLVKEWVEILIAQMKRCLQFRQLRVAWWCCQIEQGLQWLIPRLISLRKGLVGWTAPHLFKAAEWTRISFLSFVHKLYRRWKSI